jgi:lipopolysaccharide/colanic/teichoic acid biosynthesis glycosyltransferase
MSVHPILIDSRPAYLGGGDSSLLLLPIGEDSLVGHLSTQLGLVTAYRAAVVAPPRAPADYAERVALAAPGTRVVDGATGLPELIGGFEPSDTLLLVDPRSFPAEGFDAEGLLAEAPQDPRWVVHFVALGGGAGAGAGAGTREYAEIDADGRVRRVRRFYESVTWPFINGVAASILPVSALLGEPLGEVSLTELRRRLAARGVPSRDEPLPGTAIDLHDEAGLLSLIDRHVRRVFAGRTQDGPLFVGEGQKVHETARIVGPVVLHRDVVVEERAVVMGPTVLGAGAHVGAGAIVAQALVAAGCAVPPGSRVHQGGVLGNAGPEPEAAGRLRPPAAGLSLGRLADEAPSSEEEDAPRSRYMSLKRVLETALALTLLTLLAPLMAVLAVLVWLDSGKPILYGHEREGLNGRRFRCLKFRTMLQNAQALERELHAQSLVDGPQFKLQKDPRVTRVGRLLRLTNLDELPQLFNVVSGQMSLVGPRPSPFRENQLCVPWRQGRLSVRPGITGLWQVCRHDRQEGDFHQWIEYDLLYVRNMSLLVDLRILALTFVSMGGQRPVPLSWVIPQASEKGPAGPEQKRSAA